MLDKSKGLALGAELNTGGASGWAGYGATAVNTGSLLTLTNNATGYGYAFKSFTTEIGKTYTLTLVFNPISGSGPSYIFVGTSSGNNANGSSVNTTIGDKKLIFSATATTTVISLYAFGGAIGDSATLDNISVKQIAGNHAFQATSANRPILSSRVNLLTKTEDFSAADWNKAGITPTNNTTIAPDGTLTAATCTVSQTGAYREIYQGGADSTVATYTYTIYAKPLTSNCITLAIADHSITAKGYVFTLTGTGSYAVFAGDVGSAMGRVSASIEQSTNGFYKCTVIVNNITAVSVYKSIYISDSAGSNTGTLGASVAIWHPDFRPTNAGALLPPYQRVNTASDYDSVGFPLYLKCNGTSSAMSTNSIDFTSTDKMTVVTGVRKLAEAIGFILETSAAVGTYSGGFAIHTSGSGTYRIAANSTNANTTFVSDDITTFTAPLSNVISASFDLSKTTAPMIITDKVNGINPTHIYNGTPVVGVFGNYSLYLFARFNGAGYWLNGNFYGAVIRGAQSDTASVTQTENYMAQKTGITF
jgi:hypothetical protein